MSETKNWPAHILRFQCRYYWPRINLVTKADSPG